MQGLEKMNVANRLLLVQGISLIENGLQFFEWLDDYPNGATYDALTILRDRVAFFKECLFDDVNCDTLFIGRIGKTLENLQYGYKTKQEIDELLTKLRKESVVRDFEKYVKEKEN